MRISEWIAENGWTGFIERIDSGYPEAQYSAVLTEGFGTYETLEEAEAYLIDNDYKKVEAPNRYVCTECNGKGVIYMQGLRPCYRCNGKGEIHIPTAIIEYYKAVMRLQEEYKVEHTVTGFEYDEYFEYDGGVYDSGAVFKYYDQEPIKEDTD